MKIKMKIKISGDRDGKPWPEPGNELDVPEAEAKHLVEQGYAEKRSVKKK